ncbi:hypothetical protein JL721_9778 [Aureococcus anophagefferens]|nr:hypothetical protein JL721_9778 [Aureococcus anophagefferens]
MAKHHPDLIMCRKQPGIAIGRLCEKCDGNSAALESVEAVKRGGGGAPGALPRGDARRHDFEAAVPRCSTVILPLVGTVDTLWVGRLGDPQALAALGAANQVFSSVFFIVSFIPSVVTPLVAAAHASGDEALEKRRVGDALWVSCAVGLFASVMLGLFPGEALKSVLPAGTDLATRAQAQNYLGTRALAMLPAMLGFVGFATFRGILDVVTPLRVSLVTQSLNLILDPILIFGAKLGVTGAALATAASEVASAAIYLTLLARRGVFTVGDGARSLWDRVKPPSPASLAPLFVGGLGVLSRSIAMNTAFICVTRATQALDPTGEAAAAHTIAMQTWQLGGVVLFALSSVAAMLVPSTLNAPVDKGGGKVGAKLVADRMLGWGLAAGLLLAGCQLLALPLLNVFTPVESIREAARAPAMIGALLQLINGVTFVAEGVMQGHQAFFLAVNAFVASAGSSQGALLRRREEPREDDGAVLAGAAGRAARGEAPRVRHAPEEGDALDGCIVVAILVVVFDDAFRLVDGQVAEPREPGPGLYVDSHTRRGKIRYGAAPVARPPPGALERSLYYDEPAAPEPELAHLRPAPRGVHASDHMGELLTDHATPQSQRHRVSVLEPTGSLGANFVGNESEAVRCRRRADDGSQRMEWVDPRRRATVAATVAKKNFGWHEPAGETHRSNGLDPRRRQSVAQAANQKKQLGLDWDRDEHGGDERRLLGMDPRRRVTTLAAHDGRRIWAHKKSVPYRDTCLTGPGVGVARGDDLESPPKPGRWPDASTTSRRAPPTEERDDSPRKRRYDGVGATACAFAEQPHPAACDLGPAPAPPEPHWTRGSLGNSQYGVVSDREEDLPGGRGRGSGFRRMAPERRGVRADFRYR